MERAKPQAATKFLSHTGENVSRKTRKPAQLIAFSFKYQLITKLISINRYIFICSITLLLNAILPAEYLLWYVTHGPQCAVGVQQATYGIQKDRHWHHIKWT